MGQTTVQDDDSILFGSAKIETALYTAGIGALADIGAANGVKFAFPPKSEIITFDNTEEYTRFSNADKATITFETFEPNGPNLVKFMAGMATGTPVAASPVAITDELHTLTGTTSTRLTHKNGAGTEVSTIVVTDYAGNAAVRNTDYVIAIDNDGYTTIARVSGSTVITTGEVVKVDYSYTPNAAYQVDVGGIKEQAYIIIRLTNTRPSDSKIYQITGWKGVLAGDLSLSFNADGTLKPNGVPITIELIKDTSLANGAQLFKIYDEQSQV